MIKIIYFRLDGKNVEEFLEHLFVADIQKLKTNEAAYTLLMNENGGINDDAILAKVSCFFSCFGLDSSNIDHFSVMDTII